MSSPPIAQSPPGQTVETDTWTRRTDRLWLTAGAALLLVQLIALCMWSTELWQRSSLAQDSALFLQAAWLISHGHVEAHSSISGVSFWSDHSAYMWLPASLFDLLPPHGLWLYYLQDACLVGAEAIGLVWIYDLTGRARNIDAPLRRALVGLGAVMLAINPWTFEAASWDLHIETFGALSFVAAVYAFWRRRPRLAWVFIVITLMWGDVCASWVVGLGLTLIVVGLVGRATPNRRFGYHGLAGIVVAVAWLAVTAKLHGAGGGSQPFVNAISSGSSTLPGNGHSSILDLVVSVLTHPLFWVGPVWTHRVNVLATVAPSGLVGVGATWVIGIAAAILIPANFAASSLLSVPGYQQIPLATLTTVGTILVVVALLQRVPARHPAVRVAGWATIGVLGLNAVAWGYVWLPQIRNQWLHITYAQGTTLASARAAIPGQDEVIASEGICGAFAARTWIYTSGGVVPVRTRSVWFVMAPSMGIEPEPSEAAFASIGHLIDDLHAELVTRRNGVFLIHWVAPALTTTVDTTGSGTSIPAWTVPGAAGAVVSVGPPSAWHVVATGAPANVISGDFWNRAPGRYTFDIRLARVGGPFAVDVWDRTARARIARVTHVGTARSIDLRVPVTVLARRNVVPPYSGVGPFSIQPLQPQPGQVLELRISSRVAGGLSVSSIALNPAP